MAAVAASNQELHVGVHSDYGIPGPPPGRQQKEVATDAAVATDELTAGEMKVDEETHGCLAVAVDVVIPCFVARDEPFVPVAEEGLELGSQNGGDMCESCAAAAAAAEAEVVVAVAVVAVDVVAAAAVADDKGMVEVVGLRLRQHQERCRRDHQQQYHRYLTQLKMCIQYTRI